MKYVELTGSNGDIVKLYVGKCHLSNYEESDSATHQMSIVIDELPDDLATQIPYNSSSDTYTWPAPTSQYINRSGNAMNNRSINIELDKKHGDYTNKVDLPLGSTGFPRTFIKMDLADTKYGIDLFLSSLFNGYRTKFARTTRTPYSSSINYCYLLYDEDLVRYNLLGFNNGKAYYNSSNGYSYITSENKNNYFLYNGGIVFVNFWSKPSVGVEYPAFRRWSTSSVNCPITLTDDNLNNYAFLITPFTFWESDGYINGLVGYNNGTSLAGAISASQMNEMFCLEQGMLNNLKEDEPEPEPEKGDGPMYGALDTGMVTIYAISPNDATGHDNRANIRAVAKQLWAKPTLSEPTKIVTSFATSFYNVSDGILSYSLIPINLQAATDANGEAVIGKTYQLEDVIINGFNLATGFDIGGLSLGGNPDAKMAKPKSQFAIIDCGKTEFTTSDYDPHLFWNHSPYLKAQLILPFSGAFTIDLDDFLGVWMHIYCIVDLLTGSCVYEIYKQANESDKKDKYVLQYRFGGNVSSQMPITSQSWIELYQRLLTTATSVATTVATAGKGGE